MHQFSLKLEQEQIVTALLPGRALFMTVACRILKKSYLSDVCSCQELCLTEQENVNSNYFAIEKYLKRSSCGSLAWLNVGRMEKERLLLEPGFPHFPRNLIVNRVTNQRLSRVRRRIKGILTFY